MAKKLEMAGKENRIEYIEEHHHEMMAEYEKLYIRMKKNKVICPYSQEEVTETESLQEIQTENLEKIIANMEDAMYALDGDILTELIEELEGYQYKGESMKKMLAPVRRKVEMSDLMSAVEMVVRWKNEADNKENS